MYFAPEFTVIACETVDEEALQSWAAVNSGRWRPAEESRYSRRPAHVQWDFGPRRWMQAEVGTLSDQERAEWVPLMHKPPRSVVDVELSKSLEDEDEPRADLIIRSMFTHWDGYAYDLGAHEWVSELLRDILPTERIIRYEPPPPGPLPAWIWIDGIYKKRPTDDDRDADKGTG